MQVIINNQSYNFEENSSLQSAIAELQMEDTSGIAVAVNEQIIPKSEWNKINLNDEDKIIIIGAVAGG
ncbi:MAG: thiamine biosynthesis protein ThiS [Bacteroidota bacterium]|nr:thiamine biosynthesis protein ThiS [Bacteroidota bacterium]